MRVNKNMLQFSPEHPLSLLPKSCIRGGSGGGGGLGGQNPTPFKKREKNVERVCTNTPRFST